MPEITPVIHSSIQPLKSPKDLPVSGKPHGWLFCP